MRLALENERSHRRVFDTPENGEYRAAVGRNLGAAGAVGRPGAGPDSGQLVLPVGKPADTVVCRQPLASQDEKCVWQLYPAHFGSLIWPTPSVPTVNSLGCAKVLTNSYSVPLKAGTEVHAKVYASWVELWHDGRCVARHERCYRRQQQVLDLEHYLDVLYRKPGALAGSRPLEQQRRAGLWPASFDQIWQSLVERHGKQSGTRQMIEMLMLTSSMAMIGCGRRLRRRWQPAVPIPPRFGTCCMPGS